MIRNKRKLLTFLHACYHASQVADESLVNFPQFSSHRKVFQQSQNLRDELISLRMCRA